MTVAPVRPSETLQELEEEFDLLLEYLEDEDPQVAGQAQALFDQILLPKLERKIDSYVKRIQRLKSRQFYRELEARRIENLAKQDEHNLNWLTSRLQSFMETRIEQLGEKGKKLEGLYCQVTLVNNGGKPSVWINPTLTPNQIPQEYVQVIEQVNQLALRKAVLNTPDGIIRDETGQILAQVQARGKHLIIK